MDTYKKTVSFKANRNDVEDWKNKAKSGSMTLSAFILKKLGKSNSAINVDSKEWSDLIVYYKKLHKGGTESFISKVVSELVMIDKKTKGNRDISLSITYDQLMSIHAFLSTFFEFALQTEE